MSTTPPEDQQQGATTTGPTGTGGTGGGDGYNRPAPTCNIRGPRAAPRNPAAVGWVLASIIPAIVALAADSYGARGRADPFGWIPAACLLARGIGKASRVLER